MKKTYKAVVVVVFFILALHCANKGVNDTEESEFISKEYALQTLEYNQDPFNYKNTASLDIYYTADSVGIHQVEINGVQYYNPVSMLQRALYFMDSYQKTSNPDYLDRIRLYLDKVIEISTEHRGAMYIPYEFDILVHGYKDAPLTAPWYSGMAQGHALSIFSRYMSFTGDLSYMDFTRKIFKSFMNYRLPDDDIWTAFIDSDQYYWIAEYPTDIPDQVLNGYIFAIYGLYDFYQLTRDTNCKWILNGALTTMEHYFPQYRNPGDVSHYCLRHLHTDPTYHTVHFDQMITLYFMTQEDIFLEYALQLYSDYPVLDD